MPALPDTFLVPRFLVWYGLLQTAARTTELIADELQTRVGVTLPAVEVLGLLHAAEGRRLRMNQLAEELLLSPGGVTRLIARLETAGLVRRERPAEDQRAVYAIATDDGITALSTAYPVLAELVDKHYLSALTDRDARALNRMWIKLLRHADASCHGLIAELERTAKAR